MIKTHQLLFAFLLSTFLSCKENSSSSKLSKNDTEVIKGNYVLFLRPSDKKFDSLKEENGIFEADSDFGFAIQNTIDSLNTNQKYKDLKSSVSTKRYFKIKNCKNCPPKFDRDTIFYGIILNAPNKEMKILTNIHSGNYLSEINEYFKLK